MFTAKDVMALREMSGAGMMDCKRALVETDGDMDKAMEYLREKSLAATAKKASRIAAEGIVDSYIHMGGKIGVLLEVNCETDFVAKTDDFKQLVHDIAMHIAASNPTYITKEEVDQAEIEHEKKILREQAMNEPKPKPASTSVFISRAMAATAAKSIVLPPPMASPDSFNDTRLYLSISFSFLLSIYKKGTSNNVPFC